MAQYRDDFRMVDTAGQTVIMQVPTVQALTLSHGTVLGGSRTPVKNSDLAIKSYVDRHFLANPKTDVDANSSDILGLPAVPNANSDAASKTYFTALVSKYSSEKLMHHGKLIHHVGPPVQDSDLATKAYVTRAPYDQLGGSKIVQVGFPRVPNDMASMDYVKKKKDFFSKTDLHAHQIKNLSPAILSRDAVTKSQLDAIAALYTVVGTVAAPLDMAGHLLQNVGNLPLHPQAAHLVNLASMKKYLATFQNDDMRGKKGQELLNVGIPTANDSMASRTYVASTLAGKTANDQGMSRVTNLGAIATITQPTDLVSKKLVDDELSGTALVLATRATSDMGSRRVLHVQEATRPSQMVTKHQIDTILTGIDLTDKQYRKITNVGAPTANADMATLDYTEQQMAQHIWGIANGQRVTNVGDPSAPTDAINQKTLVASIAAAQTNDMQNRRVTNVATGTAPTDGVTRSQAKLATGILLTSGIDAKGVTRRVATGADQKLASKADLATYTKPSVPINDPDAIVERQIAQLLGDTISIFAYSTAALAPTSRFPICLSYGKAFAGTTVPPTGLDFSSIKANFSHLLPLLANLGPGQTYAFPILPPSLKESCVPRVLVWAGNFATGLPNAYVKILDTYFEYAHSPSQMGELKLTLAYHGTDDKFAIAITRIGNGGSPTTTSYYSSTLVRHTGSAISMVIFDIDIPKSSRSFVASNGRFSARFRMESSNTFGISHAAPKNKVILHGGDPGINHAFAAFTTSNPEWLARYLLALKIA